ncbi:MAG: amidohydrolase family protein [Firmicutes bacterium]|nr:amidohydrolase family protein [Bacillota bacterium]
MKVDAHQHFWDVTRFHYAWLDREENARIRRTFLPDDLSPLLSEVGMDVTVVVQAQNSADETLALLAWAEQYDWIAGIVGWVPLDQPEEAARQLEAYHRHPKFRGVRHLIHEERDPNWLVRDTVLEGLGIVASYHLPFDVVAVFPRHLPLLPRVIERIPELTLVIDHLAKPPIRTGHLQPWQEAMRAVADSPRVFAKISGLNTAAPWESWRVEDLQAPVDFAMTLFGPDRVMFGSDWPVATLAGTYRQYWDAMQQLITPYGPYAVQQVFGETAARVYQLKPKG